MFFNTINLFKINYYLKKKKIKININKNETPIIRIFLQLNIIRLVSNDKNKFIVYFQYVNNEPVFKSIKNMYKPSKPYFMNLKQIIKLNKKSNFIYFLSTNKGIISNFEAEKYKIGGTLVLQFKI